MDADWGAVLSLVDLARAIPSSQHLVRYVMIMNSLGQECAISIARSDDLYLVIALPKTIACRIARGAEGMKAH